MSLDELQARLSDGTLSPSGEWCSDLSDHWQPIATLAEALIPSKDSTGDLAVTILSCSLPLLAALMIFGPIFAPSQNKTLFHWLIIPYAGCYLAAFLHQRLNWPRSFGYGVILAALLFNITTLDRQIAATADPAHSVEESTPETELEPYILPDDSITAVASSNNLYRYTHRTQTSYNECSYLFTENPYREIFQRTNARDTLPVERAKYFAQYFSSIPYEKDTGPQDLFLTIRTKRGNCFAKSLALYDMMTRGGARNVYLVFGKLCHPNPSGHAWIYWEKDGHRYIVEATSENMFHDIDDIRRDNRLFKYYSRHWPQWAISENKCYVFGR